MYVCTNCKNAKRKEEEVICKDCGKGEMVWVNHVTDMVTGEVTPIDLSEKEKMIELLSTPNKKISLKL